MFWFLFGLILGALFILYAVVEQFKKADKFDVFKDVILNTKA